MFPAPAARPLTERLIEARATACAARARGDDDTADAWDKRVDRLLDELSESVANTPH